MHPNYLLPVRCSEMVRTIVTGRVKTERRHRLPFTSKRFKSGECNAGGAGIRILCHTTAAILTGILRQFLDVVQKNGFLGRS